MTIRNRLKLIGMVPITLLILLSSYFFITSYLNFEKANALKTTLKNNAILDKALTDIGKERGLTALYLGSDKKEFAAPVEKQRSTMDKVSKSLQTDLITKDATYLPWLLDLLGEKNQAQSTQYKQLLTNLAALPATRKKVDTETVEFKTVFFTDYTESIATPALPTSPVTRG